MTIGIGAAGPNAGLAVFRALAAAEAVGHGAIGGFAVFAVLTADGRVIRAETQRGGSATLFTDGETTGGPPPPEVASARFAAVVGVAAGECSREGGDVQRGLVRDVT